MEFAMSKLIFGTSALLLLAPDFVWRRGQEPFHRLSSPLSERFKLSRRRKERQEKMFQKILLAYDGSAGAKRALDAALELAHVSHAELWALAVEERLPHYAATIDEMEEAKEFANHYYQEALSVAYLHALRSGVELRS